MPFPADFRAPKRYAARSIFTSTVRSPGRKYLALHAEFGRDRVRPPSLQLMSGNHRTQRMLRRPSSSAATSIGASNAGHLEEKNPKYRRCTATRRSPTTTSGCQARSTRLRRASWRGARFIWTAMDGMVLPPRPARQMRRGVGNDVSKAPGDGEVSSVPDAAAGGLIKAAAMTWVVAWFQRRTGAFVAGFRQITAGGWVYLGLRASSAGCRRPGGRRDSLRRRCFVIVK